MQNIAATCASPRQEVAEPSARQRLQLTPPEDARRARPPLRRPEPSREPRPPPQPPATSCGVAGHGPRAARPNRPPTSRAPRAAPPHALPPPPRGPPTPRCRARGRTASALPAPLCADARACSAPCASRPAPSSPEYARRANARATPSPCRGVAARGRRRRSLPCRASHRPPARRRSAGDREQ